MTRRQDPARLYLAARTGIFRRLVDAEHDDELEAEHLISAWERHADEAGITRGSSAYWDTAWEWIAAQRAARKEP